MSHSNAAYLFGYGWGVMCGVLISDGAWYLIAVGSAITVAGIVLMVRAKC